MVAELNSFASISTSLAKLSDWRYYELYAYKQDTIKVLRFKMMHGPLAYPVKQLKTCLLFLLTGSDTLRENVATAGGLM